MLVIRPAIAEAPQSNSIEINPPYGPKTNEFHTVRVGNFNKNVANSYNGRHYSKEEVVELIKSYSSQYGISANLPLAIARCESGYNQFSKNKSSSASGVFQYLIGTWAGTDEGKAGLSVFDADANVRAAIKYIASRGNASPWNSSKSCWS
jgi:soluble lytic murein transglycosylase-like protein